MRFLLSFLPAFFLIFAVSSLPRAHAQPPRKTENILFVMTDGLRWQEVFGGADTALMNLQSGGVKDVDALQKQFGANTANARREKLMPFLWSVVANQGQIYGNRTKNSHASVTNGRNFSYPGYNETLTGWADPRVDSNAKRLNANVTVLEWLHQKPAYRGKVAAFAAWDVFPFILNAPRAGFLVNAGFDPLLSGKMTPQIALLNRLKTDMPRTWDGEPYDALTFETALEYLKLNKPRVLFVSLGETDEWAHGGSYAEYLKSARRVDTYVKTLWETVQSLPQYRGKTTLIFSPDHGRGDAPAGWKSHGASVAGSEAIWLAVLGPDTPARGERENVSLITQSQIAATLAAFLGENFNAAVPQAGKPIADVLGGK